MVIAEEMQDAMNEEIHNLIAEGVLPFKRLPLRGLNRHDHIPEQVRMDVAKRLSNHGKGQDIGWKIALEVLPVQFCYLLIIQ